MTFDDLIERLEKAAGPDRITDGLIFKALEERPGDVWNDFGEGVWYRRDPNDSCAYDGPREYTKSIDAALTLVPKEHDFWVCGVEGDYSAEVGPSTSFQSQQAQHLASTPAIALCIAALKARVSEQSSAQRPEGS